MKTPFKFLLLCTPLLFKSCAVGPDYCAPENFVGETWVSPSEETAVTMETPLSQWWEVFEDPLLTKYLALACEYNYDVLTATSNIFQARAMRQVAASSFYPQIGADVNATKTYFSKNGPVFAIGPSTGSNPGTISSNTGLSFAAQIPQIQNLFNALFDFTWEIDLFGKTRRSVEAADAVIGSAIENRNDVLITVMAEIARNYMELRSFQKRTVLIEENVILLEKKSALIHRQYETGYVSLLDRETIDAELATERAKLPDIQAQIYRNIYILSTLVGSQPEALLEELLPSQPLPKVPAHVAVGLKSDLLRRRPDVRRAERDLAEATANIGVAVASFFPSITLIGDGGLQSLALSKLFSWNSRTWAYGGDILTPVFQGGRLRGNWKAECARADAALHTYRQTVLNALEEAESTLIAYTQSLKTGNERLRATEHYGEVVNLSQARNRNGLVSLLSLLDAERQFNSAQQSQLDSEIATLLNLVALYKALGGSCSETCLIDPQNP